MKFVALALLAAVGSAGVLATRSAWERHHEAVIRGLDDEPPPVDCPFCGGNPTQHLRNLRNIFDYQASLILAFTLKR